MRIPRANCRRSSAKKVAEGSTRNKLSDPGKRKTPPPRSRPASGAATDMVKVSTNNRSSVNRILGAQKSKPALVSLGYTSVISCTRYSSIVQARTNTVIAASHSGSAAQKAASCRAEVRIRHPWPAPAASSGVATVGSLAAAVDALSAGWFVARPSLFDCRINPAKLLPRNSWPRAADTYPAPRGTRARESSRSTSSDRPGPILAGRACLAAVRDKVGIEQAAPFDGFITTGVLHQRRQGASHPMLERKREALLRPIGDRFRQQIAERRGSALALSRYLSTGRSTLRRDATCSHRRSCARSQPGPGRPTAREAPANAPCSLASESRSSWLVM